MNLSPTARKVLEERYLRPGETLKERLKAIARQLASAENCNQDTWSARFYSALDSGLFILNSPVLANYGVPGRKPQGSACFVLAVKDSLRDIGNTKTKAMLIQKSGGGTGLNFSTLRPRGAVIASTGHSSGGVIPFLRSFHADCQAVSQGGFRRGAFMAVLDCRHPDVEEFIEIKRDFRELTHFNLSVGVTDTFLEAVITDQDWELFWLNRYGRKEISRRVSAAQLFERIVGAAHANGEPGLLFLDRLQAANPIPSRPINCTNPCGEQPLSPWESCVLGHLNLPAHLKHSSGGHSGNPGHPGQVWQIDFPKLADTIETLVRVLDNIVTINVYPLPIIKKTHGLSRKIGLGFTGLADVLIRCGVPYGTAEGRSLAGQIMSFINENAFQASIRLGQERGSFPLFPRSIYAGKVPALRNAARTTVAPTGTTSVILGVEGFGCEPLPAIAYHRTMLNGQKAPVVSELFRTIAREEGWGTPELINLAMTEGTAQVPGVPAKWREVFATAGEIPWQEHIRMQAELQTHVDSAISKTINLPAEATIGDVREAYLAAYQTGVIKGITVYRAGSRQGAPVEAGLGPKCDC